MAFFKKKLPRAAKVQDMAKKIFVRANVVKSSRWYIDFRAYDPATGEESRQRKEFGLNQIEDLAVREAVAQQLANNIELFAGAEKSAKPSEAAGPTLKEAVELAVSVKMRLPRKSSRRRYPTVAKPLLAWAKKHHYENLPVADFSRKLAIAYWDALLASKDLRGRTANNYLDGLRSLWNVMDEREMVRENPWERIKPLREGEKLRRAFTDEERRAVAAYAEKTDYWLFRGILLQFFCYIRPSELVRLRFRDFDLGAGTVTVRETESKSYRKATKTIPAAIMHYFLDGKFEKCPANYFVFGRVEERRVQRMAPSSVAIDEGRLYKRHSKMLSKMKEAGLIAGSLAGLSWYSWKDTGISMHAAKTGPVPTKDQAAHRSLDVTALYYHPPVVNSPYRDLENDLF